jgi:hypothetical protein
MPDALPDSTLPISRLVTGSTNGFSYGRDCYLTQARLCNQFDTGSFIHELIYLAMACSVSVYVCDVCGSRPDGSPQERDFVHRSTSLYLTSGGAVRISPILT